MQAQEAAEEEEVELSTFHEVFITCICDVVNALKLAVGRS